MLDLQKLLDTYAALKAHDNEIMARRPASAPRGAWRQENQSGIQSSFRVLSGKKQFIARINYDTAPILDIYTMGDHPKVVEHIDLRADDATERLTKYDLPAPDDMLDFEFAAIRRRIGLTQPQLAPLLNLGSRYRVSEYERGAQKIPGHTARLMRAYDDDHRPADWPI